MAVCVFVYLEYNFWSNWHRNFIFLHDGTSWPYLRHWVKVRVIHWKMLIWQPGHHFNSVFLVESINLVKVISRSRSQCQRSKIKGQIVSIWPSISEREVGFQLKGILVTAVFESWEESEYAIHRWTIRLCFPLWLLFLSLLLSIDRKLANWLKTSKS